MRTFSAMSVPDKELTMEAYKLLYHYFEAISFCETVSPVSKEKLVVKTSRLQILMDVLEQDLVSQ